jgi:hypothetical protein
VRRRRRSRVAGQTAEDEGEADQPESLPKQPAPGARVVESGAEEPHRVDERERVADPAGKRDDLLRNQAEEDDRENDEQGDERRGPRLTRERAEERAEGAEGRSREEQADRK